MKTPNLITQRKRPNDFQKVIDIVFYTYGAPSLSEGNENVLRNCENDCVLIEIRIAVSLET